MEIAANVTEGEDFVVCVNLMSSETILLGCPLDVTLNITDNDKTGELLV